MEKNQKELKAHIRIEHTPVFGSLIQTSYTSTSSFCDDFINPLFCKTFSDYYGSKIEVAMNRSIITTIAFCENGIEDSKRFKAIERLITKESLSDVDNKIKMINNTISTDRIHNQYRLTQDCKEALEVLIPSRAISNGKINWNSISGEGCISNSFSLNEPPKIIIQVQLDLNKLIKFIYTPQDEDGKPIKRDDEDNYQYMATLGGPINPVAGLGGQMIVKNWQLFILKLSDKQIKELEKSYGVSGSNNLGFIC